MKKTILLTLVLTLVLTLQSCGGMGTGQSLIAPGNTTAQTSAIGQNTGLLGNLLSSVLQGKTSKETLTGTWNYEGPSVKFESENVLSQIGGAVMSNKLESLMQTQLTKMGMTKGYSTLTFTSDGQYTLQLKGKQYTGTYTLADNQLTLNGAFGMTHQTCTASVQGGTLHMLFDASALMGIATKLSAKSTTLSSLLGKYSGVKLGWTMTK